jgi:hypothetical protein
MNGAEGLQSLGSERLNGLDLFSTLTITDD